MPIEMRNISSSQVSVSPMPARHISSVPSKCRTRRVTQKECADCIARFFPTLRIRVAAVPFPTIPVLGTDGETPSSTVYNSEIPVFRVGVSKAKLLEHRYQIVHHFEFDPFGRINLHSHAPGERSTAFMPEPHSKTHVASVVPYFYNGCAIEEPAFFCYEKTNV